MRTIFLIAALALGIHAAGTQLPNGVELPPGMSVEQAKQLAKQNGAAGRDSSLAKDGASNSGISRSIDGSIDPEEGSIPVDSLKRIKPRASSANKQRWGQSIFSAGASSIADSYVGAVGPEYALGPGDEIILTIWGQKDARYQIELDRDGQVAIELVGVISLNGQTVRSAEELLRKRLTKVYAGLNDGSTQMDLTLGKLKRVRVYVTGDAKKPGSFMLSGNTSVLAALFQAGGPSNLGTEREIEVRRGNQILKIDLYDYLARGQRPSRDILQDGDLVRIPRKGKVVVIEGDIGRPGEYELLPKEGVKELLGYAGGLNATTASASITAMRLFENGRRDAVVLPTPAEVLAGKNADLADGDSLKIYKGVDRAAATAYLEGEIRYPGNYPVASGMTLGKIIEQAGGLTPSAYERRALISRVLPDSSPMVLRHDLSQGEGPVIQALDRIKIANRFDMIYPDSVYISGAVRSPGSYLWEQGMTVKDLILRAGGFLKRAEFGMLRLETPLTDKEESRIEILSVDSNLSAGASDHPIEAAAHLAIPADPLSNELEFVDVRGWVVRPGRYSLIRNDERLSEVIARAGGLKREGYAEGSKLLRGESDGARIQVQFAKAIAKPGSKDDLPLRQGDTIIVPKKPATVEVLGRVNSPGHVVWQEGRKWSWYIEQAGGYADSAYENGVYVQFADGSVQTNASGIKDKPNAGSVVTVPLRAPPEPLAFKDIISGVNAVLATVIAGLTIMVLLQK